MKKRAIRVTLCDTMGFEQTEALAGPSIRDFEYIMDGHIKDGYEVKGHFWGLVWGSAGQTSHSILALISQ